MIVIRQEAKMESEKGFSLAETVIVAAVAAVFIVGLSMVNSTYLSAALGHSDTIEAGLLNEEGIEATRFIRDSSWTSNILPLTPGSDYYLHWSGTTWTTTTTPQMSGNFIRTVKFDTVYRNALDDIAVSGTLDPNTRLVTSSVSWSTKSGTSTKQLQTYLTNAFDN